MRPMVIFAAVCISTNACAQAAPPKMGDKPLVQVKPKEPIGCKLVGTVKGTKLWAGDCVASDQLGARHPRQKLKPCRSEQHESFRLAKNSRVRAEGRGKEDFECT